MLYSSISALSLATAIQAERIAEAEHTRAVRRARRSTRAARGDAGIPACRAPQPWVTIPAEESG